MIRQSKQAALEEKMKQIGIKNSDLKEQFIPVGGPGGQKRNRSASGVSVTHIPTGIRVKCQENRSQAINRFLARRRLVSKLETMLLGKESEDGRRIARKKKQKRKRYKRAKTKYAPNVKRE